MEHGNNDRWRAGHHGESEADVCCNVGLLINSNDTENIIIFMLYLNIITYLFSYTDLIKNTFLSSINYYVYIQFY